MVRAIVSASKSEITTESRAGEREPRAAAQLAIRDNPGRAEPPAPRTISACAPCPWPGFLP